MLEDAAPDTRASISKVQAAAFIETRALHQKQLTGVERATLLELATSVPWSTPEKISVFAAIANSKSIKTIANRRLLQNFEAFIDYFTEREWAILLNPSIGGMVKLEMIFKRLCSLGCRLPSENTSKGMTSLHLILTETVEKLNRMASGVKKTQLEANKKDFKTMSEKMPQLAATIDLPANPAEFRMNSEAMYECAYPDGDDPVPCKISRTKLIEELATYRCRGSGSPAKPVYNITENCEQPVMGMLNMLVRSMQEQQQQQQSLLPRIRFSEFDRLRRKPSRALADWVDDDEDGRPRRKRPRALSALADAVERRDDEGLAVDDDEDGGPWGKRPRALSALADSVGRRDDEGHAVDDDDEDGGPRRKRPRASGDDEGHAVDDDDEDGGPRRKRPRASGALAEIPPPSVLHRRWSAEIGQPPQVEDGSIAVNGGKPIVDKASVDVDAEVLIEGLLARNRLRKEENAQKQKQARQDKKEKELEDKKKEALGAAVAKPTEAAEAAVEVPKKEKKKRAGEAAVAETEAAVEVSKNKKKNGAAEAAVAEKSEAAKAAIKSPKTKRKKTTKRKNEAIEPPKTEIDTPQKSKQEAKQTRTGKPSLPTKQKTEAEAVRPPGAIKKVSNPQYGHTSTRNKFVCRTGWTGLGQSTSFAYVEVIVIFLCSRPARFYFFISAARPLGGRHGGGD